ncbi:MAG: iron ABC transporter permease [Acidobacteria bacterium]|nr:iron ABC transporter permease [Acidobacteriota bacterium]
MSNRARFLIVCVVLVIALWLIFYPQLFIALESLRTSSGWGLAHYQEFFSERANIQATLNSLWISVWSVLLAAIIGTPLAFLFHRLEFPGRKTFSALAALPMLLPPLVGTIAIMFLYGESGIMTRSIQWLFGLSQPPFQFSGFFAILAVHAYTLYVYFFLFVTAGLERLDESQLEAARSLGASEFQVFRNVTLPLLTPALVGASLLTFLTSMASFSAPYLFGGGTRVLTVQIFNSKVNGDLALAYTQSLVLVAASLLVLIVLRHYETRRSYASLSKGAGTFRRRIKNRKLERIFGALSIAAVIFLLLPHLTILLVSFVEEGSWTTQILPPQYTVDNYRRLFGDPQFFQPIHNSVVMSLTATVANLLWGFVAAYLLSAKKPFWGRRILEAIILLPWAIPGTVLAIGLASTFSVHAPLRGQMVLVGTSWILPIAYFIRNAPLVVRALQSSFAQIEASIEEAAYSLGAGALYTMRRVLVPLVFPGMLAGCLMAFVLALGEFVASIVLYTVDNRPISVEILAQLRQFSFGTSAAYGVILILLIATAFLIARFASREATEISL